MRRDLVLPVLLVIALMVMAVYAANGKPRAAELATTPAPCQSSQLIGRLVGLNEASGLAVSRRDRSCSGRITTPANRRCTRLPPTASRRVACVWRERRSRIGRAMTVAECPAGNCLYIGDIGDNNHRRQTITVYRTAEPSPGDGTTTAVETFAANYPEGPQDAEGLFAFRRIAVRRDQR